MVETVRLLGNMLLFSGLSARKYSLLTAPINLNGHPMSSSNRGCVSNALTLFMLEIAWFQVPGRAGSA